MKNKIFIFFLIILNSSFVLSSETGRMLRSGSEYDYPPFCIVNPDSTAGGFSIELIQAVCEAMDLKVSFKVDEWNKIKQELAEGKLDVLPLVGRTPERESLYDFTIPYMTFHGAVFARKGDERFRTKEDLKNVSIAVLKGDNAEEYMIREKITDNIISVDSFEKAFILLSEGGCDAVITQKVMGLNLLKDLDIKNVIPVQDLKDYEQSFSFAVTKGNSKLLAALNEGLSVVIADGIYNKLYKKWFSPEPEFGNIRITIGVDSNYPPFSFMNNKGEMTGFNVDLIKSVAKRLELIIDIKPGNIPELKRSLLNNSIDAVAGLYFSEEDTKNYRFTPPYLITDFVIVTRSDTDQISKISDVINRKVIVLKDYSTSRDIFSNKPDEEMIFASSTEEALKLLADKKYDYALLPHTLAHYFIYKNKYKDLKIIERSYLPQEYCFAVAKYNESLLRHISDALIVMKESGEYRRIYSKWLGAYHGSEIDYNKIIKYSISVMILLVVLIIVIISWNKTLQNKVVNKTEELSERESLLYGLFDNMPSGSAVYEVKNKGDNGSDYIVKFFNKMSLEIEGMSLDQVVGKSLYDLRPEIDSYGLIPKMKKVWETGKPEFFPAAAYNDQKYSNYYENHIFKLSSGEIVTIYDDVTQRILAEKRIRESEEKYRQIFESANAGILLTLPDGTILSANPEACRIFDRTEEEIIKLGRDKLFDTEDPAFNESLKIRKKTGSFKGEISAIKKDGSFVPLYLTSNLYLSTDGEDRAITIFRDNSERKMIEERKKEYLEKLERNKIATLNLLKDINKEVDQRKQAEEDLRLLNQELEEKVKQRTAEIEKRNKDLAKAQDSLVLLLEDVNESRDQLNIANENYKLINKELETFTYSVSHDLRSPARAIIGFSEILEKDYEKTLDKEGQRLLRRITENAVKMQSLIDDLLEFSRVGTTNIHKEDIDLKKMLRQKFEELNELEKERKFNFFIDDNIPVIRGDRVLCSQLFENLLSNAIKFTSKKEISEIKINYMDNKEFDIISVEDNGAGFDSSCKYKLFKAFQRLHSSEEFSGTGVGLSIVHKVVSKHGWSIDAEGEIDQGAKFFIKIPKNNEGA